MIDSLTKLLEAVAALLGALAWPALIIFLVLRFTPQLRKFADNLAQATVKVGPTGFELSASQQMAEAAANLVAAQAKPPADDQAIQEKRIDTGNVTQALQYLNQRTLPRLAGARVLWVDDRPQNNVYERQALEALGIQVMTALSTTEALDKMRTQRWDVIVSDMGRPESRQAGYDLLAQVRQMGLKIPYIIYAGSNAPEHKAETVRRGGQGTTNNPTELFQMVISAILNPPA